MFTKLFDSTKQLPRCSAKSCSSKSSLKSSFKSFWSGLLIVPLVLASLLSIQGYHHPALAAANQLPADLSGTIAYLAAKDTEIRLVEADGTNDRRLWQVPNTEYYTVSGLDWNTDANTLAFTSNHEQHCSLRRSDIFTIDPNGTNLQRITNHPKCSALSSYPKGTVTVRVRNIIANASLVAVYVTGAPEAQLATVSPGTSVLVTINDVADFGDGVEQNVVVYAGNTTWINPAAVADVVADSSVSAGEIQMSNANKVDSWGSYSPSWNRHGDRIGFALGEIGAYEISAHPAIGDWGAPMISGENSFAGAVAMSPVADELLYYSYPYLYLAKVGETGTKSALVEPSGIYGGGSWLPDGSGFVFAEYNTILGFGNLFEYRFDGPTLTNLTELNEGFPYHPSVSPDGDYIVYAYAAKTEDTPVLKVRTRDGSQVWDLGVQGHAPSWGKKASVPATTPTATPISATATPVSPTATPIAPTPLPTQSSTPVNTPTAVATSDPVTPSHKIYLPSVQR